MPAIIYLTGNENQKNWRYLWARHVIGFQSSIHCARCLKGEYIKPIGKHMPANEWIDIDLPDGEWLYLCGVASHRCWADNLHLACRISAGDQASVLTHHGDKIVIDGAAAYLFDDQKARELFPERGEDFLTCRNFQFAAQVYGRPAPPSPAA